MMRRAWSMVAAGLPKRPKGPIVLPQRPIEDVEQPVMPFDRAQAGDGHSRFDMKEREAAIAPLRRT